MAKLSLSEVSNRFNISRSTLYRAIKEGRLSRSTDGLFDVSEVIRCFGEPTKKQDNAQTLDRPKDDADLRQLVEFMKREIESYKDREQRYLDQIDRFQLLLGHKESSEKSSHETPMTQPNDTTCDTSNKIPETPSIKEMKQNDMSHDSSMKRLNDAPRDISMKHHETPQKQPRKRGLFGRVLNAVFNEN